MDVLFGKILQIDAVDLRGAFFIVRHLGRRRDVVDAFRDLIDPGAVLDPHLFESRGYRQADGALAAGGIRHHKLRRHRVEAALHAFDGGVETLQVDDDIDPVCFVVSPEPCRIGIDRCVPGQQGVLLIGGVQGRRRCC